MGVDTGKGRIADFRLERLARRAPSVPLAIGDEDFEYLAGHLRAIGDAFAISALPSAPLSKLPANALARHLADLKAVLAPATLDQRLALGRLESVIRMVESAVTVMENMGRRRA